MMERKKKMQEQEEQTKLNEFIQMQKLNIPTNISNLLENSAPGMALVPNAALPQIPLPKPLQANSHVNANLSALNEIELKIRESEEKKFNPNIDLEKLPKDETYKLYKDMLRRAGITSTWKWEDCQRVLQNESIWKVIKTFKEKRSLFDEYIKECKTRERDEQQLKRDKLRTKYRQMLEEDHSLTSETKFSDAVKKFCGDERWRAIDERDREDLFQDYLDDLEKRENEDKRIQRETKMRAFRRILEDKRLPSATKWKEICLNFKDDHFFNAIEKLDRLKVFCDYITELENKEKAERDWSRKLAEYRNRESFRDFLQNAVDKNEINSKTKWKNLLLKIKEDANYLDLLGQEGSTPKDLFDDVVSILKEDYKRNKDTLKKILKVNSIKFNSETPFEEFEKKLNAFAEFAMIREDMRVILWSNLTQKLKEKEKEFVKNEKKALRKLGSFIKKKVCFTLDTEFEEILNQVKSHSRFLLLPPEKIRAVFEKLKDLLSKGELLMDKLDNETSSESGQIKKKKSKRKKNKKKKKRVDEDSEEVASNDEEAENASYKRSKLDDTFQNHSELDDGDVNNFNKKVRSFKDAKSKSGSLVKKQFADEKEPGETSD